MQSPTHSDTSTPESQGPAAPSVESDMPADKAPEARPKEYGGRRDGPEPTRYGDWEKNGRCIDF